MVITLQRGVALGLSRKREGHQFASAFAVGRVHVNIFARRSVHRFRIIAGYSPRPVIDPIAQRFLDSILGRFAVDLQAVEFHQFGRGLKRGLADRLCLVKCPKIGRLDIEAERCGLRALTERFGERQAQRNHGDQERDLLVLALAFSVTAAVRVFLVFDLVFGFMLNRVHAMAHWSPPSLWSQKDVANPAPSARGEFAIAGTDTFWTRDLCARGEPLSSRRALKLADGRCDRLRAAARCRRRYKPGWSTVRRGPATPGWPEGRRHVPEDVLQKSDAAHVA